MGLLGSSPQLSKRRWWDPPLVIEGDGVALMGGPPATFITNINPCRSPNEIDIQTGSLHYAGIYQLDGKTLRVCLENYPNMARPSKFETDGDKWLSVVLKRGD